MQEQYKAEAFKAQVGIVAKNLNKPQPLFDMAFSNCDPAQMLNQQQQGWCSPKVIYTSRTHSQLAQAMKELKTTEYRYLKAVALGSRDQLCINEDVLKEANTSSEKQHLCRSKVKAKQCNLFGRADKTIERPEVTEKPVMDIEDLVKVGAKCHCCPYYLAKTLSENADVVFMPYNYLLDTKLLKSFKLNLNDAIVILDEGHNVEKMCEDAASVSISSRDIALCCEDITHIMEMLDKDQEFLTMGDDNSETDFDLEDLGKAKQLVLNVETEIDAINVVTSAGGIHMSGSHIFEILGKAGLDNETFPIYEKLFDSLVQYLTQATASRTFGRKGIGLMKFSELMGVVFGTMSKDFETYKRDMERGYKVFVELEDPNKKNFQKNKATKSADGWLSKQKDQPSIVNNPKQVNYWCFNPGFGMANLINRHVRSIILTSGTLAPLKPLISELGLEVKHRLENPHVIQASQVMVKIVSQGPDRETLDSCFKNRDNPKYINSLGLTIRSIANVTPHGLLVFFPSYPVMNKCQEAWQQSGVWKTINEIKPIFTEPRRKDEFIECMKDYYTTVNIGRGAIFMAVLRGKVSEGLDFTDQNGRAVIVTGLPYPPLFDQRVVLKKKYLDENRTRENQLQSGQEWYSLEATRAVNQAIGRVIRHKDDYGAILLCDQRFNYTKSNLSHWIQPHLKSQKDANFGSVIGSLSRFFRNASSTLPPPKENNALESIVKMEQDENYQNINLLNIAAAKKSLNNINKRQIKIENSNEIYGAGSSGVSSPFFEFDMKNFIKKEPQETSFFGGLNKDISTIDFNTTEGGSSGLVTIHKKERSRDDCPDEFENATKKRKLKMVPNKSPTIVNEQKTEIDLKDLFAPVNLKREYFIMEPPQERSELLNAVSRKILQCSIILTYNSS